MIYNINPSIYSCFFILFFVLAVFLISIVLIKNSIPISNNSYVIYAFLFLTFLFTIYILSKSLFGYVKVTENNIEIKTFGEKYYYNKTDIKKVNKINIKEVSLSRKNGISFFSFNSGVFSENGFKTIILTNDDLNQEIYFNDSKIIIPSSISIK